MITITKAIQNLEKSDEILTDELMKVQALSEWYGRSPIVDEELSEVLSDLEGSICSAISSVQALNGKILAYLEWFENDGDTSKLKGKDNE